ncbi:HEAT repeat domain-containing protein [Amycolatopsis sp. CA-128772]|uniref:HEAT repeat domain-containing protein n=1 Tax=Amycolatopsis sp. CA-128772 TaxID=2073159 RepID=UPI000CD198C9|nr:HEAT repeat domain-containing protein [Amycolatopsis sp. CA-128772]
MIEFEDVQQWVEFDLAVRREWWYSGGRRTAREALAFAACSPDGREREATVSRLAVSPDPEAVALLLIRCVDWVPQVRAAARKAVLSKLDDAALRALLPLIGVLRRRQVDDWMTGLFRRSLLSSLDTALALEDRESRRFAHREALGLLSRERLLAIASTHPDFVVRAICGNELLDRGECVEELLAAGAPKVRVRALTLLGPDAAVACLADRSSAVRTMAQALVPDPAAVYRALPVSFGALAGLGETGTAADAPRLEEHLADARPRIRRAAVRGLRRIAPESAAVRPLLTDPSPAVTRQVVAFLRGRFVDPATLRPLLAAGHPLHTRRAAAALLRDHGTWLRLHTDLTLLRDPDLAPDAHQDIHAWLHHSADTYTTPSPALAAEIEAHLDLLPPETARQIRFALPGTRNSRD